MDGDVAPVDKLADVCAHHGALLVLDEAHAVLGPEPDDATLAGVDRAAGRHALEDARRARRLRRRSRALTDLLVNRARSYIFTTASTPADAAAALAALRIVRSPEGDDAARPPARQRRAAASRPPVADRARRVRERGARARGRRRARSTRGLLVPAIRPPTVPPGTSRLRVALSAAHTPEQVDRLAAALAELFPDERVTA